MPAMELEMSSSEHVWHVTYDLNGQPRLSCSTLSAAQKNYFLKNAGGELDSYGFHTSITEKALDTWLASKESIGHRFDVASCCHFPIENNLNYARLILMAAPRTVEQDGNGNYTKITFARDADNPQSAERNRNIVSALHLLVGEHEGLNDQSQVFLFGKELCHDLALKLGHPGPIERGFASDTLPPEEPAAAPEPAPLPPAVTSAGRDESGFSSLRAMRNVVKPAIDFLIGVADRILGIHIRH